MSQGQHRVLMSFAQQSKPCTAALLKYQIRIPRVEPIPFFSLPFPRRYQRRRSYVMSFFFLSVNYFVQITVLPCPCSSWKYVYHCINNNETRRSKSSQMSFLRIVQNGLNHNSKIHIAHQFCDFQYIISFRQLSTVKPV